MKERPILFSGEMVRAILDGRKTQTRSIIKPQPVEAGFGRNAIVRPYCTGTKWPLAYYERRGSCWNSSLPLKCPYGKSADRLWVRETWSQPCGILRYRADGDRGNWDVWKWAPSIHMPRWASRITLEITAVRVERLNDITEEAAIKEGCHPTNRAEGTLFAGSIHRVKGTPKVFPCAKSAYRDVWESINGPGSWELNPWVWVIEFRRVAK